MRGLLVGIVAVTVLVPTWAMAGNQEVAERIAANLRQSGQLHDYKIGVKFQDGTAWLRGRASSQAQMDTAVRLVQETPGVTRVVNDMQIGSEDVVPSNARPLRQIDGAVSPERLPRLISPGLRSPEPLAANRADRVATSFAPRPLQPVTATATEPTLAPPKPRPRSLAPAQPAPPMVAMQPAARPQGQPIPIGYTQGAGPVPLAQGGPIPQYASAVGGVAPARYDQPHLPNYAWPSYAAYPNYAALTYPKQYSPTAWPYIGPFYPYPQVPLGWRKVTLEWHDGWWQLDFDDGPRRGWISGLFRPCR